MFDTGFSLIKKIHFYFKVVFLFLIGKKSRAEEYARDYDIVSKTYDDQWIKKMGRHTKEMLEEVKFNDKYFMLDLACGTGFIIEEALKFGSPRKIIGIDNSREMLKKAKIKINLPNCQLIEGNILSEIKKMPDNYFDVITCGWAFCYISEKDKNELLKDIYRILKKDGILAVITNRKGTILAIENFFMKLMQKQPSKIRIIDSIKFNLIKNKDYLKKIFIKNKLKWVKGWDKEESFVFYKGEDATKWVKESGILAGTFNIFDNDNFWNQLAEIIDNSIKKNKEFKIIHKFSVGIAKKC